VGLIENGNVGPRVPRSPEERGTSDYQGGGRGKKRVHIPFQAGTTGYRRLASKLSVVITTARGSKKGILREDNLWGVATTG